jgi:hypothetical protein
VKIQVILNESLNQNEERIKINHLDKHHHRPSDQQIFVASLSLPLCKELFAPRIDRWMDGRTGVVVVE